MIASGAPDHDHSAERWAGLADGSPARRSSPTARTRAPTPTSASPWSQARWPSRAGAGVADPLIGLGITLAILKITRDSWITVRGSGEA